MKCFLGHINMLYSLGFRASRGREVPPSRTHLPRLYSGRAFAAAITAVVLICGSALGLTAPLQKSRRRPCHAYLTLSALCDFYSLTFLVTIIYIFTNKKISGVARYIIKIPTLSSNTCTYWVKLSHHYYLIRYTCI